MRTLTSGGHGAAGGLPETPSSAALGGLLTLPAMPADVCIVDEASTTHWLPIATVGSAIFDAALEAGRLDPESILQIPSETPGVEAAELVKHVVDQAQRSVEQRLRRYWSGIPLRESTEGHRLYDLALTDRPDRTSPLGQAPVDEAPCLHWFGNAFIAPRLDTVPDRLSQIIHLVIDSAVGPCSPFVTASTARHGHMMCAITEELDSLAEIWDQLGRCEYALAHWLGVGPDDSVEYEYMAMHFGIDCDGSWPSTSQWMEAMERIAPCLDYELARANRAKAERVSLSQPALFRQAVGCRLKGIEKDATDHERLWCQWIRKALRLTRFIKRREARMDLSSIFSPVNEEIDSIDPAMCQIVNTDDAPFVDQLLSDLEEMSLQTDELPELYLAAETCEEVLASANYLETVLLNDSILRAAICVNELCQDANPNQYSLGLA